MVSYFARQEHENRTVEVLIFQSAPQTLSFVSTYSATSRRTAGLMFVQYFAAPSKDGSSRILLLNERPLPPDDELLGPVIEGLSRTEDHRFLADLVKPEVRPNSLTLAQGLSSVAFRTLAGLEGEGSGIGSRATVPGRLQEPLPAGIHVQLKWQEQEPLGSKEFAIVVPIQGNRGSGWDLLGKR